MKRLSLLFILLLHGMSISAQKDSTALVLLDSIALPAAVDKVSNDRNGFLYFSDISGNLYKLDASGKLLFTLSLSKKRRIDALEAWRNLNIFAYYANFQEYTWIDRFLSESPMLGIPQTVATFPKLVCPSGDQNLWVFDEATFRLMKYDTRFNTIVISTPLDLILKEESYQLSFMREYQNQLFISDVNSGILIFDNMGNFKNRLSFQGISYFSFWEDQLVWATDKQLIMHPLYSGEVKSLPLPAGRAPVALLVQDGKWYVWEKNHLFIYGIK
jgi:hypothetical protein